MHKFNLIYYYLILSLNYPFLFLKSTNLHNLHNKLLCIIAKYVVISRWKHERRNSNVTNTSKLLDFARNETT